jgi:tetratricopeptide (TPR) repeat protein
MENSMLSQSNCQLADEKRIELILIGQVHSLKGEISSVFYSDAKNSKESQDRPIYSQFRIMQILELYKDAAVLLEGSEVDTLPSKRRDEYTSALQEIFPEYKDFSKMDVDRLTDKQKIILKDNYATTILFHLGKISSVYQTKNQKRNVKKIMADYFDSYNQLLSSYPDLFVKSMMKEGGAILERDLTTLDELKKFKQFCQKFRPKNPDIFYNREKEALDFVIRAAEKSGKKRVVLIFGSGHMESIAELIQKEYQDKIVLKISIDSTEGHNNPDKRKELEIEYQEAMRCYKAGEYKEARPYFEKQVSFWQATPKSTPTKIPSLLASEFNLGSCFLKLAESGEEFSYEEAVKHLKKAVNLEKDINKNKGKQALQKYSARYEEALRRHCIVSFFNKMQSKNPIAGLVIAYSDESELSKQPKNKIR